MSASINRRDWLKTNSLAAMALGFSLPSMANEEGLLRNFGREQGLINLGSNENPYGISPNAKEAILEMIGEAHRYQFNVASLQNFEKTIADHCKISSSQVLATAGSGDALGKLARHFTKGSLVTATPTFATLPNTAKRLGTKVIEVPLTAQKTHDLSAMLKAIDGNTQMVYICNPANPSSTIVSSMKLVDFCIEAAKKAVVIVDEAYIDFLDAPDNLSMIGLIDNNPNVLVVRTFSKIHAMAGLRVGYVAGHASLIKELNDNHFSNSKMNISNLAATAALASLKDKSHTTYCKQQNAIARDYTFRSLKEMKIDCIPSYTNFLFFPLGKYPGDFSKDMLAKNVILRSSSYPDGKWARVSVGTMDEMKKFIGLMKADWKL